MGKRTDRIQLMLESDEVKALDDWRFEMRMPSRAAAMRALMRLGLKLDLDREELGVDPQHVASGDIGIVGGPAMDTNRFDGNGSAIPVDEKTADIARHLAELRSSTPSEALRDACELALSSWQAEPDAMESEKVRAPTRSRAIGRSRMASGPE